MENKQSATDPNIKWAKEMGSLNSEWHIVSGHHLERGFKFKDFRDALAFTNRIGEAAERQDHHPDIKLGWGAVTVQIWTHTVDGLMPADFDLARAIDMLV
jgi:4a-hydroxytetrahydrobiopterin dehydratase